MRSILFVSTVISFNAWGFGCEKSKPIQTSNPPTLSGSGNETGGAIAPNTAVMYVHGMSCPQCAYNVDLQLLKVPGVHNVKVNMSTGRVTAQYAPDQPPTREQLAAAIKQTGFTLVKLEMR